MTEQEFQAKREILDKLNNVIIASEAKAAQARILMDRILDDIHADPALNPNYGDDWQ
jgi:hypothetical protein